MKPLLAVRNLAVAWDKGKPVFSDLNFELGAGDMVGVVGPSGCGKSTLCLALAGIIPRQLPGYVTGEVKLLDRDLTSLSLPEITSNLGVVFQDPETQLFLPQVRNELAFGPENLKVPREDLLSRIRDVAQHTGCERWLDVNPNELSGGQQQIVALAAVLALQPQVLLLDEVTSQLDPASCQRIQQIIVQLRRQGVAVLMVEHDLEQLAQAERILALRDGGMETIAAGQALSDRGLDRIYGG